jgi:hypothetical protein
MQDRKEDGMSFPTEFIMIGSSGGGGRGGFFEDDNEHLHFIKLIVYLKQLIHCQHVNKNINP